MERGRERKITELLSYLPASLGREVLGILRGRTDGVRELRLRAGATSRILIGGREYPLYTRLDADGLRRVLELVCHGSLYAYRDRLAAGSLSVGAGIRVAVAGEAKYEGGELVGIDAVSSILFRIPGDVCEFAGEIVDGWRRLGCANMLVLAPPLGGKTTALREIARLIGSGEERRRVVVVDERCEFDLADYPSASVDILRGYRRGLGTELAVRIMSPEVILVDEIASRRDAEAARDAVGVGVPIIATVHAERERDLWRRDFIAELLRDGCFRLYTVISRAGGSFVASAPAPISREQIASDAALATSTEASDSPVLDSAPLAAEPILPALVTV